MSKSKIKRKNSDFDTFLLEATSVTQLKNVKKYTEKLLKYNWRYFSELAEQRNQIREEIQQALIQQSTTFDFSRWQRAVKYKYGLHPLSSVGSLVHVGGRFNTGKYVNSEIPSFAGLYIASNKDTALQEHLGQSPNSSQLSPRELALTNPESETIVSVSGHLDKIFDLTQADNLVPFLDLIARFKVSKELKVMAH